MSILIDSSKTFFKQFIPQFIADGVEFYSEHRQGVSGEDLVPEMIGRFSYHVTRSLGVAGSWYTETSITAGLGLAWALGTYKGLPERTWMVQWSAFAFTSVVDRALGNVMGRNSWGSYLSTQYFSRQNMGIIDFALTSLILMVQGAVLYSLKAHRYGAAVTKPYLYYGAGVVCLTQLVERYLFPKKQHVSNGSAYSCIQKNKEASWAKKGMQLLRQIVASNATKECLKTVLIGSFVNYSVYRLTGAGIPIDRRVQALGILGAHAAKYGLNWLFPHS